MARQQTGSGDGRDTRHHSLHNHRRDGHPFRRPGEALGEHRLEGGLGFPRLRESSGTDRICLDQGEVPSLGIVLQLLDEGIEDQPRTLSPVPLPALGSDDAAGGAAGGEVIGTQKAILFIREVLVEGGGGDTGQMNEVADLDRLVALVSDDFDHCPVDASRLVRGNVGRDHARPWGQLVRHGLPLVLQLAAYP